MKIAEKTKSWIKDHREGLIITGAWVGVAAVYAGVVALSIKMYNNDVKETQAFQNMLSEAVSRGDSILPGPNGYYWIIPNEGN